MYQDEYINGGFDGDDRNAQTISKTSGYSGIHVKNDDGQEEQILSMEANNAIKEQNDNEERRYWFNQNKKIAENVKQEFYRKIKAE